MPASLFEYAVKAAALFAAKDNRQYAFLFKKDQLIAAGAHSGEASATYQTALVNALQNSTGVIDRSSTWAVCSYIPTVMCSGMAYLLGVRGILIPSEKPMGIAAMRNKKEWSQADFQRAAPGFTGNANKADPFDWKTITRLELAESAATFNPSAIKLMEGMKAQAAKAYTTRAQESSILASGLDILPISAPPGAGAFALADETYTHLVFGMVGQTWNPTAQATFNGGLAQQEGEQAMGNNIAGVLLDDKFQIVAWALNFASENQTFHAETLMLQRFLRKKGLNKLPPNYTIYTSLQPCDMCAGFILHVGDATTVKYCLRDVGLTTALSSKTAGTQESQIRIDAATDIAKKLADKHKVNKTHSAGLLRDAPDAQYREDKYYLALEDVWLARNRLSRQDLDDLIFLDDKKRRGKWLSKSDFNWLCWAQRQYNIVSQHQAQRGNLSDKRLADSPLKADGSLDMTKDRLGFSFVKSADKILEWAKSSADDKQKKGAQQGVEVFEAILAAGFSTAYGLKLTDVLFAQAFAKESLTKMASAVATAAKPG